MSSLHDQAHKFADTLSASVSGFLGREVPFGAEILEGGDRVSVQDQDAAGITLEIGGSVSGRGKVPAGGQVRSPLVAK